MYDLCNWLWELFFYFLRQYTDLCCPLVLVQFKIAGDIFLHVQPVTTFAR
jgi:hypothetical protein